MLEIVIRYAHFLGIIVLSAMLVAQHLLLSAEINRDELRKLGRIDAVYGASALLVFLAGLGLWVMVGKPAAYYSANTIFMVKVSLFIVIALLSVYPTVFFIKSRKRGAEKIIVPKSVIMTIRVELMLLLILPLLAVLMARGYGLE